MTDLCERIYLAQHALAEAAPYAARGDEHMARFLVWQARQCLKPIRRPPIGRKTSPQPRGGRRVEL